MVQRLWRSIKRFFQFLREVRGELRKVTWPSLEEVVGTTTVVLIAIFVFAFYLFLCDMLLDRMVRIFYQLLG